jgi:trk system potassium uptake protein
MHHSVTLRVTGILLALFSLVLFLPIVVALIYSEDTVETFATAGAITLAAGLLLMFSRRERRELRSGDGFLITVLFYSGLGLFGAIPLYLAEGVDTGFTDSVFESLSGLTTTGATVLSGLDDMPRSILFYRQLLQWLGGMGIIVLAVAVLPMLGIGGMQLYRAEFTGPVKDSKLTPRITETAKALWYLYLGITAACAPRTGLRG